MEKKKQSRLSREDWIEGAMQLMLTAGVEGVKIVPLAACLGVTSGSFYWHFKNHRELLTAMLEHWEQRMTDDVIELARRLNTPPKERIHNLMRQVMSKGAARHDLAIWHMAQFDADADIVFRRVLDKRFDFAMWMFKQAGFSESEAKTRGRMMVVYMMAESTLIPGNKQSRKKQVDAQFRLLTNPCD